MSIKAMMDAPYLTHKKARKDTTQRNLKQSMSSMSRYSQLTYDSDLPELDMLEDFLVGFLTGSTFAGNPQCKGSMTGMIYQGFQVVKNREVYNPSKVMKAVIAAQKFQEQQSLFYA